MLKAGWRFAVPTSGDWSDKVPCLYRYLYEKDRTLTEGVGIGGGGTWLAMDRGDQNASLSMHTSSRRFRSSISSTRGNASMTAATSMLGIA